MTFMRSPIARSATMAPMLPRPTTPRTLLHTSVPIQRSRGHSPALSEAFACGMLRATASNSESACSAVVTLLPPGVFITTTPRLVAASTSMLSTPMPARPITRRVSARASTSAVTLVRLLTISAWQPGITSRSSAGPRSGRVTISSSGCSRNRASPSGPSESLNRTRYGMASAGREPLGQDGLGGADPAAELHGRPELPERQLERGEPGEHVERADVAKVGETHDLALEAILPSGEGHAHAVAE